MMRVHNRQIVFVAATVWQIVVRETEIGVCVNSLLITFGFDNL